MSISRSFPRLALLAAFLVQVAASAPAAADDFRAYDVEIVYPWARAAAPGTDGAVYMKLVNTGDYADRLVRAASPYAGRVRLPAGGIGIAPGQTVVLGPGGVSVALDGLSMPLVEGTALPLTLTFERGGTVDIEATIAAPEALAPPAE